MEEQQPIQKIPILKSAIIGTAIAVPIGIGAFVLGIRNNQEPVVVGRADAISNTASPVAAEIDLKIKGNKTSRIFHLKNCPNYNDIAERNIVWFKTAEAARARGFRMARNC